MDSNNEKARIQVQWSAYLRRKIKDGWAEGFAVAVADGRNDGFAAFEGATDATMSGQCVPVTADTVFNIGSVTKPVTAMLLAKLVEQGEVSLTDKVRSIVPEYPFADMDLFHLLAHTAGYDNQISLSRPLVQQGQAGKSAYMREIYGIMERKTEPGETVLYFTEGYIIIADLIERVAGTDLERLAREVLFEPLAMTSATFDPMRARGANTVYPVAVDGRAMLDIADWAVTGDSGLYTNIGDLLRLGRMFLSGGASATGRQVLHERTVRWLLTDASEGRFNQTPAFWIKGTRDKYGCFAELHSASAVAHTGFSGCMLWIDPAYGATGAILTNSTRLHEDWARYRKISNRMLGTLPVQ